MELHTLGVDGGYTQDDVIAVGDHSLFVGAIELLEDGHAASSLVRVHGGYRAL